MRPEQNTVGFLSSPVRARPFSGKTVGCNVWGLKGFTPLKCSLSPDDDLGLGKAQLTSDFHTDVTEAQKI